MDSIKELEVLVEHDPLLPRCIADLSSQLPFFGMILGTQFQAQKQDPE